MTVPIAAPSPDRRRAVSVALATYNGTRFLREQLESLRAQTLQPLELVIGDDRSDDDTAAIVAAFARTVSFPVRFVVNAERLHFGGNFLAAAARCEGRYLAFCDQDDIWLPEKLERCVDAMETTDALICGHDAWLIDAAAQRIGRLAHLRRGNVFEPLTLAPWGVFFGFATVIRRDLLDDLPAAERGPDNIDPRRLLAHDRWVYFLGTTLGRSVYLKEPLVLYRQHGNNTFGAGRSGSALARVAKLLLTDPHDVAFHLDLCRQRRDLLARAARSAGPRSAAAAAGAVHWAQLASLYEHRLALAAAASLGARVRSFSSLLVSGAYAAPARGGLSARALVKDALAAVLPKRAGSAIAPVERTCP